MSSCQPNQSHLKNENERKKAVEHLLNQASQHFL